jgi:hypothetical protein
VGQLEKDYRDHSLSIIHELALEIEGGGGSQMPGPLRQAVGMYRIRLGAYLNYIAMREAMIEILQAWTGSRNKK